MACLCFSSRSNPLRPSLVLELKSNVYLIESRGVTKLKSVAESVRKLQLYHRRETLTIDESLLLSNDTVPGMIISRLSVTKVARFLVNFHFFLSVQQDDRFLVVEISSAMKPYLERIVSVFNNFFRSQSFQPSNLFIDYLNLHRSKANLANDRFGRDVVETFKRLDDSNHIQLNNIMISGFRAQNNTTCSFLPTHRKPGDPPNVQRVFSDDGHISFSYRMKKSEELIVLIRIGSTAILALPITGGLLDSNQFLTVTRNELFESTEKILPLPDSFSITFVSSPVLATHQNTQSIRRPVADSTDTEKRAYILTTLPVYAYNHGMEDDECQICIEKFEPAEMVMSLPCLHSFHEKCMQSWTEHKLLCPNCRADIYSLLEH
jgi:Ring finger domain